MGAAAIAGIVAGLGVPAGGGVALLADVANGERRDGRAQYRRRCSSD